MKGYKHILVAVDLSETSDHLVERARSLLAPDGRITIVYALVDAPLTPTVEFQLAPQTELFGQYRKAATEALDAFAKKHAATEGETISSRLLSTHSPWSAVCEFATEVEADLVVVGTHGRKGISRLMLGSVAEMIVRHAPTSVLVDRITGG